MAEDVVLIAFVVVGDIEIEEFVYEIVDAFFGFDAEVLDSALHQQIFFDHQEG